MWASASAVVDVGAEGVARDAALRVRFAARHLGAAEAARDGDTDTEGAALHGALDGLLDGAAEGDAAFELVGDGACDQVGVKLRRANLLDVDANAAAAEAFERVAKLFDLGAAAADDDARLRGVNRDGHQVRVAVDLDVADGRVGQLVQDEAAQLEVLVEAGGVVLLREPLGLPVVDDAEPEAVRMYFLSQY